MLGQKKDKVLVTIDGQEIKVADFKRVYEKNLDAIEDKEAKNVNNNLELFINYKLKVKEAYALRLDTLPSYKREIETYRNQLIAPYLQDQEFLDELIKETYFRTKNEIKASHILINLPRNYKDSDTLVAYNKIISARNKIINGASFKQIANEVSEDPSVKINGGDLGYFSAFKMLFPFEDTAYKTKLGEVSKPFKTRYGYHIVKSYDIRPSKGEVEVAHILINNNDKDAKTKIEKVYEELTKGTDFKTLAKQFSNDKGSKEKGGRLPKFGMGRMVKPFEVNAFSLNNEGDFSKPFKTRFGWHILKLVKKHPVQSFEKMKDEITNRVKKSGRRKLSDEAVLNRLKKEYTIVENEQAKQILKRQNIRAIPIDSLQESLFVINKKQIRQEEFIEFIRNRRHKTTTDLYNMFLDDQVLTYFKENLVNTEPEYAYSLQEYEDGLLLFELMQQKVWNKSSKDSIGLKTFFDKNKLNYKSEKLSSIKGIVMNDYQIHLEKEWVTELTSRSKIKINKRQLKKLIKFYNKED
jgi:peptidyl-prolyl cis-trans isomerase SurA